MGKKVLAIMLCTTAALAAFGDAPDKTSCTIGDVPVPGLSVKSLKPASFRALHKAVIPGGATERWAEIPWQSDLQAARKKAFEEGKPLVMWIMDGHPLGCT